MYILISVITWIQYWRFRSLVFLTLRFPAIYMHDGAETGKLEHQRGNEDILQVSDLQKPATDNCIGRGLTGTHGPVHLLPPKIWSEGHRGIVVSVGFSSSVTKFWRTKESQENIYLLTPILQLQDALHKYSEHIRQSSGLAERKVISGCS